MIYKNLRDAAVVVLALGTAYGLGVISCVAYEIKLLAECSRGTEKSDHKVSYRDFYDKHKTEKGS